MTHLRKKLFTDNEWQSMVNAMGLSKRQGEIAYEILSGKTDKEIAATLSIGVPTIRTHMSRLFEKLGVDDRNELMYSIFSRFFDGCRETGCTKVCRGSKRGSSTAGSS